MTQFEFHKFQTYCKFRDVLSPGFLPASRSIVDPVIKKQAELRVAQLEKEFPEFPARYAAVVERRKT